ncbi:MAG: ABC transporter permease [Paraglaciecola sp.]|uniref:ABC transporter permease n=1 Tax=Paraglaciecola sp. TaxID=1920173 RepID=UPI00273D55BE|nr:ABC transporter permease [Paraglaciecola sp.]MDP5031299.1 ABC transporter permease [Paraglaciecola sp.]MDP5132849.1 ABC transporter permease [Paraglaciecola sp.]
MWLVFLKELKELLRDKKTLFFMIALPLLIFPLIFGGVAFVTKQAIEKAETKVLKYAMVGAEYAPVIVDHLQQPDKFELVDIGAETDYATLIRNETIDFVLIIPNSYNSDVLSAGQSTIQLYLNDAGLNLVYKRVNEIVKEQSDRFQLEAFSTLGLEASQQQALLEPIVLEKVNTADDRENWGEKIGGMLPYLLFILCLQGAMFPATDIGAGEKERGTLETLLISPIDRNKIVFGKFFTIAFAGTMTALITVVSMAGWGLVLSQGMAVKFVADFMGQIGVLDFILIFLMLVPVVAIFAAVLLSISIYAKSFKEAQSYMGPLVIFVIIPVILALLPGVELKGGWAWVPLTNVALAMKELVKGTMDYFQLIAIFGSTVLIAGALIAFCVYWFKQEKVLFR